MQLSGLHLLLSYRCTDECDHCFLWSGPKARGTMTLEQIRRIIDQAKDLGTVDSICYEGGEPFLFYPLLLAGLRAASAAGFDTGIVTNCYWATSEEDAVEWLRPIAEIPGIGVGLSSDLFHGEAMMTQAAKNASAARERLDIGGGILSIRPIDDGGGSQPPEKGEPIVGGPVRFRGRAVAKLAADVQQQPWSRFTECPDEDFTNIQRVHVDAYGYVHACQGLCIGNVWEQPLKNIVEEYDPHAHPIIGPLVGGGPVALVKQYNVPHAETYADACHLCYTARDALRSRFPQLLAPPTAYGDLDSQEILGLHPTNANIR